MTRLTAGQSTVDNDGIAASVIVPCWNVERWLDAALDSALVAADRIAPRRVEIICVDDGSTDGTAAILSRRAKADGRIRVLQRANGGLSAARNTGLSAAHGEYVLFLDPDDEVKPGWIADGIAAMESSGADWFISPFDIREGDDVAFWTQPLKDRYAFDSNDAIIDGFLPRIIGYSFDDLRRWFAGEELFATREFGSVCRCVYRRDVIERHGVRFDETLRLWEDAFFNCEYLLHARRTATSDSPLYNYTIRGSGIMKRFDATRTSAENKFAALRLRRRLNELSGGRLARLYAASCVFAPLEIVATFRTNGLGPLGSLKAARRYLRDPEAAQALRECPLSMRRPLFTAAVLFLRLISPSRLTCRP